MFRKLTLAALIATGTIGGFAITPATASDHLAAFGQLNHGRYQVLVRHRGHWDVHGTYHDRDEAYRVAHHLERRGIDVSVERIGGR